MNVDTLRKLFMTHFRAKRMARFEKLFSLTDETTILDVGGGQFNWGFVHASPDIVVLNLEEPPDWNDRRSNFKLVIGDGMHLPFPDASFDIVYSNSVIEHVGDWNNQVLFARDIKRVGRTLYVQTPAKEFFVEPHLLTPFFHWLPPSLQSALILNFTVWGLLARPSRATIKKFLAETRLLTYPEFCRLFSGCSIVKEHFCGLTKSYIAYDIPSTDSIDGAPRKGIRFLEATAGLRPKEAA